ncbi:MAG: T9SS type A sorting domain-containing protein [Rhodothermaceae bacterium]|nr:T9SS type A sorting domain-containing protein [Rhodothermaceae bacterium]
MKNRLVAGSSILIVCLLALIFSLTQSSETPQGLTAFAEIEAPDIPRAATYQKGDDAVSRASFEYRMLRNPESGAIPTNMRTRELALAEKLPARAYASKQGAETWTSRGPVNVGGRTRALAIDQDYNGTTNRRVLAGGVSGGLFVSEDFGATWQLTSPLDKLASVTALAQDPTDSNVWYYGTGEFSGNSASARGAGYFGHGMFKSTDGGNTWSQLASTLTSSTSLNGSPNDLNSADNLFDFVWDIEVHPNTGDVYVGGWGVILVSEDGGNSWTNSLETFASRAEVEIASNGTVYAALSKDGTPSQVFGIYRLDGPNWTDISPPTLVADPYRIVLDAPPSDPTQLYALVQATANGGQTEDHQFFKWNGSSWTDLSSSLPEVTENSPSGDAPLAGGPAEFVSQGGYDLMVKVSPNNPDVVWIGGTNLYRSTDGGSSFTRVGGYVNAYSAGLYPNHHPDQHNMAFLPTNPNVVISSHDGGLSMTTNALEANQSWTSLNNGYQTTQFFTVAIDPEPTSATQNSILGGMQDNGTYTTDAFDANTDWDQIFSGDGSFAAIVPGGETIYVSAQEGFVFRFVGNTFTNVAPAGASDFLFITPFVLDPNDANVMYIAAGNDVWRNSNLSAIPDFSNDPTNVGWSALSNASGSSGFIVTALGVPNQSATANVMYFGETLDSENNPATNLIRVNDPANNGAGENITPTGVTPGSWTSSIVINEIDELEMMVTYSNYGVPSVFHTSDGGQTWNNVEGNLGGNSGPSVRWAAIMPTAAGGTYFLATSIGVFSTSNLNGAGTVWEQESPDGMGNVVATMLASRASDGLVVAATHGRGIYSANVMGTITSNEDGIEVPTEARLDQNYPNPFNPETTIKYELSASQQVELSVFDATGRRVQVLENGFKNAGTHEVTWNGKDQSGQAVASGMYIYRLHVLGTNGAIEQSLSGEMVLLK